MSWLTDAAIAAALITSATLIACHRPRPKAEAYLRLRTLPGEEGQVDWGLCRARHSPHYAESGTMPSIVDTAAFSAQLTILGSA